MTIEQAMQIAIRHHQAGQLAQAESLCREVLSRDQNHAGALHLLGVMAHQSGQNDIAVDLLGRAIALKPGWPQAYSNLGLALHARGQLDHAIAAHRQAVALGPSHPQTHYNLGLALKDKGQLDPAIAAYRQAVTLKPDYPRAWNNLGNALREKGLLDEAIAAFHQALAFKPDYAEAYSNLGNALRDKGLGDEAITACRRAIALRPDFAEAYSNLGNALRDLGLLDEAIASHRQAIALQPGFPQGYTNLGVTLKERGELDEAVAAHRQAVALKPGDADGHYNLALVLLCRGDFAEGWKEHEWRWQIKEFPSIPWNYSQPQWDGSDLADRTILIHGEQGFGDVIQFVRYIPMVARRCKRIIGGCYPQLRRLLAGIPGVAQWVTPGEALPPFDVHCPLMSLPLAFGSTLQNIPASVPYLLADAAEIERWRGRLLGDHVRMKVGVVWAGRSTHKNDRNRSLFLSGLAPLARVQGVSFYSLQKGEPAMQLKDPPAGMNLIDWTEELNDFADTAALIANLDLVISVDTAVAHLAGALGKSVWMLAPAVTDWRWLLDREDSPWYPTMRLFRQKATGRWDEAVERMAQCLERQGREPSMRMEPE